MHPLALAVLLTYALCAVLLSAHGLHRYHMTALYLRTRDRGSRPLPTPVDELPRVTVQLPVFNERYVIERLIDAAAELDYPADRLQLQVLDDSTDDTRALAAEAVDRWRRRGLDIEHIHRSVRSGFKAGALEAGLEDATGEFIAIFDADFIPQQDFLRQALPHFRPDVGMVQARWGHINPSQSLLTRLEAVLLDGHFVVEHTARNRSGRWFNFNGTAGIWRREAIDDAGGWQHDTLTEDLDLSYRSQLAGWRFVYLPDLVVPSELPPTMGAFKSQQHRWAKGSIQTMRKLLVRLLRADIPLKVKLEAAVHLSHNLAYPLVLVLTLLTPPAVLIRAGAGGMMEGVDLLVFLAATLGVGLFYATSQWGAYADWRRRALWIPLVMALGIGLAVNQTRAVVEALLGHESPFVRTPKSGGLEGGYGTARSHAGLLELLLALYQAAGMAWAFSVGSWASLPLQLLFVVGFGAVGIETLRGEAARVRERRRAQVAA